ncbi:MAG: macro domain-containing protein [Proteobacteria bacterium]|nr:macro domain-containing protein [Pseudomonadota bacterium]
MLSAFDRISVAYQSINTLEVDAVVNAANSALSGGGGVDGAIHDAAGPELLAECLKLGRCPAGSAVATAAYRLPARWVIHAVGPVWEGGGKKEAELLASAYRAALAIAAEREVKTIAFPAISCGAYRYPIREASRIALSEVGGFLSSNRHPMSVTFACVEPKVFSAFERALASLRAES